MHQSSHSTRSRELDLDEQLGEEEASEVQAAMAGAIEHLRTVEEALKYILDEQDIDLYRIRLALNDLHDIEGQF